MEELHRESYIRGHHIYGILVLERFAVREGSPQRGGSILCSLHAMLLCPAYDLSTSLFAKAIACEGRMQDGDPLG